MDETKHKSQIANRTNHLREWMYGRGEFGTMGKNCI